MRLIKCSTGEKANSYRKYLLTKHWKEKRDKIIKDNKFVCSKCGDMATEVHHLNYDSLGNENDEDLMPLCQWCHRVIHGLSNECEYVLADSINQEYTKISKDDYDKFWSDNKDYIDNSINEKLYDKIDKDKGVVALPVVSYSGFVNNLELLNMIKKHKEERT